LCLRNIGLHKTTRGSRRGQFISGGLTYRRINFGNRAAAPSSAILRAIACDAAPCTGDDSDLVFETLAHRRFLTFNLQ